MPGRADLGESWRSPNGVTALAILAALTVLLACGGLAVYAGASVDSITVARETRLMQRAVDRRLAQLGDDVASVAVWSDAYDFTARRYDAVWAQVNYGVYFHQYLHHDISLVLDAADRPIYAAVEGKAVPVDTMGAFLDGGRPLVARVRQTAASKIVRSPSGLGFARVGAAQATIRVGEKFYLVAASTVVPEEGYRKPLLGASDPVILSGVEVGPAYLASLDADYGLAHARLATATDAEPAVPLRSAQGRTLTAISWNPERPGVGVIRSARGWIVGVAFAALGAVALLVVRLRSFAKALARARDRALAGDTAKSAFIANISHEIRTPLNGVLGMAHIMSSGELSAAQRDRLDVIQESGATLLALLDDVLDLSKMESGKLEIHPESFDLGALAERVCAGFAGTAASKDVALRLEFAADLRGDWTGDPLRIRQVLSNLLSNAIKFTAEGSVTLEITSGIGGVRFAVADTGIGIPQSKVEHIFGKFVQADTTTTRRFGGSGLGLAISKDLAEAMGGTIEVSSRPDEGSTFVLSLPLIRAEVATRLAEAEAPASPQIDGTLRVLAAEDNPVNQMVLRSLLEPLEVELTLVSDGRAAVDAFVGGAFDLMLMDIQMPEMNGMEAAVAIRAYEAEKGLLRTPILALTANVMTHQLDAYRAAGMDGHVAKPFDIRALYAALEAALAAARACRPEQLGASSAA